MGGQLDGIVTRCGECVRGHRIEGLDGQVYCPMFNSRFFEKGWCPNGRKAYGDMFNEDALACILKDDWASAQDLPEPPKITVCGNCVYYKEVAGMDSVCTANSALAMDGLQWCDYGLGEDETMSNRRKLQAYIESVEAARTGREME